MVNIVEGSFQVVNAVVAASESKGTANYELVEAKMRQRSTMWEKNK